MIVNPPRRRAGSKTLLRDINRLMVLRLISEEGPLTRSQIAERTSLTPSTITHIVGNFLDSNIVTEETAPNTSAGRNPILVDLNAAIGTLVGVKMTDDEATVVVCDLRCAELYSTEYTVENAVDARSALESIARAVTAAVASSGVDPDGVLGVGIGMPGAVDRARRRVIYSHAYDWHDIPAADILEDALGLPVWIDNVVNVLATGEHHIGEAHDIENFLLLTVGRGVGMSAVINDELYRGAHGAAGDFGHVTVDASSTAPICNCGKRGCLEAVASDYGIVRASLGTDPGIHIEAQIEPILAAARSGDRRARTLFETAGAALGVGVANLMSLYDPERVLITGEGLRAQDIFWEPMLASIQANVAIRDRKDIDIRSFTTTTRSWARGAASMVLGELFKQPTDRAEEQPLLRRLLDE